MNNQAMMSEVIELQAYAIFVKWAIVCFFTLLAGGVIAGLWLKFPKRMFS